MNLMLKIITEFHQKDLCTRIIRGLSKTNYSRMRFCKKWIKKHIKISILVVGAGKKTIKGFNCEKMNYFWGWFTA